MGEEVVKRKNVRLLMAIGITVVLMALAGSLFGDTTTETGLAPPGGGLFAGATVIPSDEPNEKVYGDGFTVETVGIAGPWNTMAANVDLSTIRVVKKRDVGSAKDFRVDFECESPCLDVKTIVTLDFEEFKKGGSYLYYHCSGQGQNFRLEPGKETIYFQILGLCDGGSYTGSSIYKVSLI